MKFTQLFLIIFAFTTIFSCSKTENLPTDIEIQSFVWKGLNAYYLWQGNVPDLSDRRFSSDQQLFSYLGGFDNPSDLFKNLLYQRGTTDRFSWIVDDYIALEKSFQGIRLTSGMKLKGAVDSSGNFYVYVRDVVQDSDADLKGVTRGMLITEVNGTRLTEANANTLFGANSFTIHLADYNADNPVTNGTTIDLTKTEVSENPIKIAKVISDPSGKKIGYLMYNQFSRSFDGQLNAEFAKFKTADVTDLIIDLRYNGGGSVQTAVYLGSMITGQFDRQLYAQQKWNSKVISNSNSSSFINNFTNRILNKNKDGVVVLDEAINSLNLSTVYFIVSKSSASASELVINALSPYINVKLVGVQTYGKHVGSITLYDSDNFSRTGFNLKTSHTWAMQPIVLEIQNKLGENKPKGFIPEVAAEDNPENLGVLGDVTEPLLARTIQYITTGAKGASSKQQSFVGSNSNWNSAMTNPDYNNMYVELK